MFLAVCMECVHGGVKDGQSHCNKEAVYSHPTRCLKAVALEDYLKQNTVEEKPVKMVGNQ